MISFLFMILVAVIYLLLILTDRLIKEDKTAVRISNLILLASSYIFAGMSDYRFAAILFLLSLSTWYFAGRNNSAIGIVIACLSLGFFKYTNFFYESFSKILGMEFIALKIILPLGISFYVFSAISYISDVKKGKLERRNLLDVALYLSFFPKLTSGPIQKSKDFFQQTDQRRSLDFLKTLAGIQIFVFGLFKKIVLADRLSVFVAQVYETPLSFGSMTVFMATIAYSLQIYFDFSGYSDMAIGTAKVLGIDLPKNFNLPYLSHNVTEFWKRWHITLSEWLQEYLYIPLGGNRKGVVRAYINLVLTMVIGGIWHGPNWTYVVWGTLHGLALIVHKLWMKKTKSNVKTHTASSNIVSIVITFLFINFSWIFFRAETITKAFVIIERIMSFNSGLEQPYVWLYFGLLVLFGSTLFAIRKTENRDLPLKKQNTSYVNGLYPVLDLNKFWNLVIFFVFCGLLISLAYTGGSPFIYGNY